MNAEEIAQKLSVGGFRQKNCFIGFDGFIDHIVSLVDQRSDPEHFSPIQTICELSGRIGHFSGRNGSIERVVKESRLGGNAPLFSTALSLGKHSITFMGPIGETKGNSLFTPLREKCRQVYSLGSPAMTEAWEFSDGKIFLGDHHSLHRITVTKIREKLSLKKWRELFSSLDCIATLNWSMVLAMNEIWEFFLEEIFSQGGLLQKPLFFVDFADLKRREHGDIKRALILLNRIGHYTRLVLSCNLSEAEQLAFQQGYRVRKGHPPSLSLLGEKILQNEGIALLTIHQSSQIYSSDRKSVRKITPPPCICPRIQTGAGDHYNAGYCNALLFEWTHEDAALLGLGFAGAYIRLGKTPTLGEVSSFLREYSLNS